MTKILLLGSSGLLGASLFPYLICNSQYEVLASHDVNHKRILDVSVLDTMEDAIRDFAPDVVINLIAITDVNACQFDPNVAFEKNVLTVTNIVSVLKKIPANTRPFLIHFSSDQVYDGKENFRSNIKDISLTNIYSYSKYLSELIASDVPSLILRTNFFGLSKSMRSKSFTDWLFFHRFKLSDITLFTDVYFSPLSIETVCRILLLLIEIKPTGVFNLGSADGLSKSQFACLFYKSLGIDSTSIATSRYADSPMSKFYRPHNMMMNSDELYDILDLEAPSLLAEIYRVSSNYK